MCLDLYDIQAIALITDLGPGTSLSSFPRCYDSYHSESARPSIKSKVLIIANAHNVAKGEITADCALEDPLLFTTANLISTYWFFLLLWFCALLRSFPHDHGCCIGCQCLADFVDGSIG